MYLDTSVENRHPALYAAFLCVTLLPLYFVSWQYHTRYPYSRQPASSSRPPSTDFVADWLNTHVVEPFNPSAISAYCNQSEWNPNLIFRLDNANGGIGNVRGNILDFLFFALEAGASIMLPDMASRSDSDISNVWGGRAAFDLYFDETWFLDALRESCPQMEVYKAKDDQRMAEAIGKYLPKSRRMDEKTGDGPLNTKVAYLEHFTQWLTNQSGYHTDGLALVNTERTLWAVDTRSLPQGFRHSFSQLLRVNPTVRHLAALVVQNLATKHEVEIDPRDSIPANAFFGAHLRTEVDARNAGWLNEPGSNFSAQTDAYIESALEHNIRIMYVATGDAADLARFKLKAATHLPAVNLTSKLDLLPPHDLEMLKSLTWDQQALVDYEVLQRCSIFGGFVKSSFSYNIAMTRSEWSDEMRRVADPWLALHTEESVAFDDGLSRIIGRDGWHEHRIPRGMWP